MFHVDDHFFSRLEQIRCNDNLIFSIIENYCKDQGVDTMDRRTVLKYAVGKGLTGKEADESIGRLLDDGRVQNDGHMYSVVKHDRYFKMRIVPSIRGKKTMGCWYSNGRISLFVNMMWKRVRDCKPHFRETIFMAEFLATEFHEIGHIKIHDWKVGKQVCTSKRKCGADRCFWCKYTFELEEFFLERGCRL